MDPETSLSARAQPKVKLLPKAKKTKMSFLSLPGEIRNAVYQHYFEDTYQCELVGRGRDFDAHAPKTVKLLSNSSQARQAKPKIRTKSANHTAPSPLTHRFPQSSTHPGSRTFHGWLRSRCALILVCKQVCAEALSLLYPRITFVFAAPRHIINFLHRLPLQGQASVTKLHLHYATYGSPAAVDDVIWQQKHLESWNRACKAAAKSFIHLRELEVQIRLYEDAPKFNLRQKWLQPLLQFRRLNCDSRKAKSTDSQSWDTMPRTLQTVSVMVRTRLWAHDFEGNIHVARACRDLHELYSLGICKAILGAKEEEAMSLFNKGWFGKHRNWQHHLGFARTGW